MNLNHIIVACLALTTGIVGYVIGSESSDVDCATTWNEVREEDDFCSTWWEDNHVVIGPLHEKP